MSDAPDPSWPARCRSCDAPLHGPFCSSCGESHRYERLDVRELLDGVLDGLVKLDGRIFRTVADLTLSPAKVSRDYIDGRRVPYVHPFRYAVATVALSTLAAAQTVQKHWLTADDSGPELELLEAWAPLVNLAFAPLLAAFLFILLLGAERKLRWIEHVVIVLYALGHASLLHALATPFLGYLAGGWLAVVYPVLLVGMLSAALTGVANTNRWTTLLRVVASYTVAVLTGLVAISALLHALGPELSGWLSPGL